MKVWEPEQFDLITTTSGTWVFSFIYLGEKKIKQVDKSCGSCMSIAWQGNKVIATVAIDAIPQDQEEKISNKKITVHFDDSTFDVLRMNLTLKKKL